MVVGICHIGLHIPESRSLKDKRRVLRSLKDKLRQEFNLSVAEVEDNDLWQRATLGIAVVSNDSGFAHQVLSGAVALIERRSEVEVLEVKMEMR